MLYSEIEWSGSGAVLFFYLIRWLWWSMYQCFNCYFGAQCLHLLDLSKHSQRLAYFFCFFNRAICTRQCLPFLVQHRIVTFTLVEDIIRALSYANDWFPMYTLRLFINFVTWVFSVLVNRFIDINVGSSMIAAVWRLLILIGSSPKFCKIYGHFV